MKKYRFIYRATIMESIQYLLNMIFGFATFFIIVYIFINLWEFMYSDSSSRINGYSMQQMIWYVILTEIIWFGGRNRILTSQVSSDIKTGAIAYGMNKPYHYIFFIIAKHLGDITIKFLLFFTAGLIIGYSFIGDIPGFKPYQIPFALVSFFLGMMINSFISTGISVFSFWIEDSTPFHWIYDKMILVIGIIFPIEMFPVWLQPIVKYTPIYVVTYGPAKLMIDFSWEMVARVLAAQIIYFFLSLSILLILYQKGVKKLYVNGG